MATVQKRLTALSEALQTGEKHEIRVVWEPDPDDPMPEGLRRWVDPATGELHIRVFWDDAEEVQDGNY